MKFLKPWSQWDPSSIYMAIDCENHFHKLEEILSNTDKFSVVTRDPTTRLKTEVNKLIRSANHKSGPTILKPIVWELKPGYIYGTVKIHKTGYLLHPIFSEIPTPIHETRIVIPDRLCQLCFCSVSQEVTLLVLFLPLKEEKFICCCHR